MKLPRFYPIIDTGLLARQGISPLDMARALARAGVRVAQLRHKGPLTREVYDLGLEIAGVLREAKMQFVVNDRADLAMLLGADAIHLGQDDLPPEQVRRLVGARMAIGFSTHNEVQFRAAEREPAGYLALGPIFGTSSKDNPDPVVGLTELRRLRALTDKPLVAIGGITRSNAADALAAGADSVAVISDLLAADIEQRARAWLEVTK